MKTPSSKDLSLNHKSLEEYFGFTPEFIAEMKALDRRLAKLRAELDAAAERAA